jgi:hypothetical protein
MQSMILIMKSLVCCIQEFRLQITYPWKVAYFEDVSDKVSLHFRKNALYLYIQKGARTI